MGYDFKKLLPYGAGALAGGVLGSFGKTSPYAAAGSMAAGALANKKNPLAGALQGGVGGAAGGAVAGGLKNVFSSNTGSNLSQFGSGMGTGFNSYMSSIPGFGGYGSASPTGVFSKMLSPATTLSATGNRASFAPGGYTSNFKTPNMGKVLSGMGSTAGVGGSSPASSFMPSGSGQGMNPMNMFQKMIPGMAVAGLGGLVPQTDAPDYSGIISDFKNQMAVGGNPEARQLAMGQFRSTLQAPTGASAEPALANAKLISDRQRTENTRNIDQSFRAANPGNDYTNNSEYANAMAKMNTNMDQNYSAQAAETQFLYDQWQQQQKMAAATALQGMDDAQLQYYAGLAGLSAQQIQDQFMLDAGSAQSLRDIATMAGQFMMESASGANQIRRA